MSGEEPRLFGVEPPRPRLEAVRVVDMSASNAWADLATADRCLIMIDLRFARCLNYARSGTTMPPCFISPHRPAHQAIMRTRSSQ
jgi:hypothetical protein